MVVVVVVAGVVVVVVVAGVVVGVLEVAKPPTIELASMITTPPSIAHFPHVFRGISLPFSTLSISRK